MKRRNIIKKAKKERGDNEKKKKKYEFYIYLSTVHFFCYSFWQKHRIITVVGLLTLQRLS